jgi:hypothetical protein
VLVAPLALLPAWAALAQEAAKVPAELLAEVSGARLQGSGRLLFLGLQVYDARLWAGTSPVGETWAGTPFALELVYGRSLKGQLISERSLAEMRRQGDIAPEKAQRWLEQLQALLLDVKEGDRITGVNRPGLSARFYFNGSLRGEVADADFARVFFGIWLSPRTSEPALRLALLGDRP